jgi:hypothetical protein
MEGKREWMKEEEKEDGHTWSISCLDFVLDDRLQ